MKHTAWESILYHYLAGSSWIVVSGIVMGAFSKLLDIISYVDG
jgi:hypothetical protein